jgi:hypothetical protein
MEARELMVHLDTAVADLTGLLELWLALDDDSRAGPAWRLHAQRRAMQHEVAAGAGAYLSTLLSSGGGELTPERIEKCRADALSRMATAWPQQGELAQLVERQRLPLSALQEDLGQLALLSLEVRAALRSLGSAQAFDAKSAEPLENKVLVHLREAALAYMNAARAATGQPAGDAGRSRRAALPALERAAKHIAALTRLEAEGAQRTGAEGVPGAALRETVSGPLQKMVQEWSAPAAGEGAGPDGDAQAQAATEADADADEDEDTAPRRMAGVRAEAVPAPHAAHPR